MNHVLAAAPGVTLWPLRFDAREQAALLGDVLARVERAPFFDPTMPRTGQKFSVRMTNFGPLGWVSDAQKGYRYEPVHPATAQPWPPIPDRLLRLWHETTGYGAPPEACLVNFYDANARMGLHQDKDEAAVDAPVLSVSLGDSAYFRLGSMRTGTSRVKLNSGDVLIFGGPARLMYHGIDRILPGTSTLIPGGGRINLTLRRVTTPKTGNQTARIKAAKLKTAGQGADRPSKCAVSAGCREGITDIPVGTTSNPRAGGACRLDTTVPPQEV